MKFMPLLVALICIAAGWVRLHLVVIPVLALVNVLIVSGWRMSQVRNTPQKVGEGNRLVEGAYLLVLNVLILGAAYFLGYFLGNSL